MSASSTPPTNATTEVRSKRELRGTVLEVLRALLAGFEERDTILSIVEQLLAQNEKLTLEKAELQRRLEKVLSSSKKNEGVSASQLLLALGSLGLGSNATARLARMLAGRTARVNLMRCNPVDGVELERTPDRSLVRLRDTLARAGVPVVVRDTRGRDISAACGQLWLRDLDGVRLGRGPRAAT